MTSGDEQLAVDCGSLGEGAAQISMAADEVTAALAAIARAAEAVGAFGGEPPGAGLAEATGEAQRALSELQQTAAQLGNNVAAAASGYIVTDERTMPASWTRGQAP